MDLGFTPEEEAFRQEVRSWLDTNLPQEWRHGGIGGYREDEEESIQRDWQRRLYEGGWLTLAWPQEQGGRGASPVMQSIYAEEMARAGGWVLNGQKTWSSGAHYSDRSFLLARTNPEAPPHQGIGMFLIDLRQKGVEVRPIIQMTGSGEFCEIFLTDAQVEDRDVVGAPTDGWTLAL